MFCFILEHSSGCWLDEFVPWWELSVGCTHFSVQKITKNTSVFRTWTVPYGNTCFMFLLHVDIHDSLKGWIWSWETWVWILAWPMITVSPSANWASLVTRRKRICLQYRKARFNPWVGKILRSKEWLPTPVFLPGEFHKQKEPGRLQSTQSQRVIHNWVTNTFTFTWASNLSEPPFLHLDSKFTRPPGSAPATLSKVDYQPSLALSLSTSHTDHCSAPPTSKA